MSDVLEVENLTKAFKKNTAVDQISFAVPQGCIFGFIGENGAGKTTTMKMVLGLLKPDSGQAYICDEVVRFGMTPTNRHVGYLPDVPQFYPYMKADEYLHFCGEVSGLDRTKIRHRTGELLDLVGLKSVKKKIGGYSRGMKQRLGVAQALINNPKVLICDEPTSALDPVGRKDVLDILAQIREETTVIFSTHILSDVERVCDRAAVIHQGKLVLEGTLAQLKARRGSPGVLIEFSDPVDTARFCDLLPPDIVVARSATEVTLATTGSHTQMSLLETLVRLEILPLRFESLAPSVESLFLEAVR